MKLVEQLEQEATHTLKSTKGIFYKQAGNRWFRISANDGKGEWVLANPDPRELKTIQGEAEATAAGAVGRSRIPRAVERINMKNGRAKRYESMRSTKADGFNPSMVSLCCRGKRSSHAGFKWRYA